MRPHQSRSLRIRHPKLRSKKVLFPRTTMASSTPSSTDPSPSSRLDSLLESSLRFEELSSGTASPAPSASESASHYPYNPANPYIPPEPPMPPTPSLFTTSPVLRDQLVTHTSLEQDATVRTCVRYLSYPEDPFPILDRDAHIAFLEGGLNGGRDGKLPDYMVALDASRSWIVYWCLMGLSSLGVDVRTKYKTRVVNSLRTMQNENGGFGGGNGQMSHMTATYSAVLALAIVSGGDNEEGEVEEPLDIIDRRAMLRFLHSVKDTTTGGFRVAVNGESDVRGAYCALTIITLLGLPTTGGLVKGTREYLSRCQTFEGGFGATPDGNEAHGGYAFCALAGLCMLGEPREILRSSLDMDRLVAWLSARQYAPEGGLSGRTNKLVDGCYSTWVGGCWALVEAACNGPQIEGNEASNVVGSLWSREGLARYILTCCQGLKGGLRDKPSKAPDFYHSCYVLLGLSSTQHYSYYVSSTPITNSTQASEAPGGPFAAAPTTAVIEDEDLPLRSAFSWRVSPQIPSVVKGVFEPVVEDLPTWPDDVASEGAVGDRLREHHPIFNIPVDSVKFVEKWMSEKVGF